MPGSRIESHRCFPLLLIAASLAASGLSILRDLLINDDGVLYLMIAGMDANIGRVIRIYRVRANGASS